MNFRFVLFISSILLFSSALASLQCGTRECPDENACCNDVDLGPTCYDPTGYVCTSTGLSSLRLCGEGEDACGTICYDPTNYYCCNGNLAQKGQTCVSATSAQTNGPATTTAPTTAPTSAPTYNCPAVVSGGVNCDDPSLCCGADTMTPSCLPADGSKQCCIWYLSATQCNTTQVCGGDLGYGASSDATCGPAGSTFCNYGDAENTFCSAGQVCCGIQSSYAWCCPEGNTCNTATYSCNAPTAAPTTAAPTTSTTYNCPSIDSTYGVNCDDASLCCGADTMTPSCLPADGSKQCCVWYLSATQCNDTQVCGGDLGYGASSYATCGPAGSTFCNYGDAENTFCSAGQVCCGIQSSYAWCCPEGNTCNTSSYSCNAPADAAPTTSTTYNCPSIDSTYGVNCDDASLCCGADTMTPSCLPADGSKQCCVWYLSATQCNDTQVCGGDYGYGASSYATCGPAGSTFCNYGDAENAFCSAGQVCCGIESDYAWCCPQGNTCNTSSYSCNAPADTQTTATTFNCPSADPTYGENCEDASLCCGSGTQNPSCLPADGSKQCCVWYHDATQCNDTQVCGGSEGPGASSDAMCGPAGSTFCNYGDGENTFCSAGEVCCGIEGDRSWCCPNGNTCNTTSQSCNVPAYNCEGVNDAYGVNCAADETCCGAGTIEPSCLPADGSKQCCVWYLSAIQCNTTQVCGGSQGYGASSDAQCGPPGSTFCNYGDAENTFCSADQICCGIFADEAWCCATGDTCGSSAYQCIAPST